MSTQMEVARRKAEARIEDTLFLLSWGRPIDEVAERAGFPSCEAAGRFFYRRGMRDPGALFDRAHEAQKRAA